MIWYFLQYFPPIWKGKGRQVVSDKNLGKKNILITDPTKSSHKNEIISCEHLLGTSFLNVKWQRKLKTGFFIDFSEEWFKPILTVRKDYFHFFYQSFHWSLDLCHGQMGWVFLPIIIHGLISIPGLYFFAYM